MIQVSIIGGTGYAGQVLTGLLERHPEVKVLSIGSKSYIDKPFDQVYNNYSGIIDFKCVASDLEKMANESDVVFIALPHGIASNQVTRDILRKTKIIDLGADYRLKNVHTYEKWYEVDHGSKDLLNEAVYGLCEVHRNEIKNARLIANPGCYTTCSILSIIPLIKENLINFDSIIIDAKSGVSGAGRANQLSNLFCECNESIKPYKIASHRHTPEIEQELNRIYKTDFQILFTPHLVPMNRGILALSYANLKESISDKKLVELYKDYYRGEYFIRIRENEIPDTRFVKGSNYCDIGIKVDKRTNRVIVVGALDNLMKGAASQAVQNMNIAFGLNEKMGIDMIPSFPI